MILIICEQNEKNEKCKIIEHLINKSIFKTHYIEIIIGHALLHSL